MNKLLFIYDEIPENIHFYAVPVDHPLIPSLKKANGFVINIHECPKEDTEKAAAIFAIELALMTEGTEYHECYDPKYPEKNAVKGIGTNELAQFKIPQEELPNMSFEGAVHFGFYL